MALSPQWLDELRARVTLSSVIQRTTKLQKVGREWKACCPFHSESTPSFTVSDEKGFYHCFGCGAHGDVIRWMTDQRGLGFMDAVKELAAEAGMEVPAPDPIAAQKAEKRAELIDVTVAAQEWFVERLGSDIGAKARKYLGSRGFGESVIREFGFGYAPDDKQALPGALASFDEAMLVESGMRIETEDGQHYDRFRDRLMLPIQDARGRVIAFGGRILDKRDGVAKYLNSPDTPLFDKGSTLYNLHRASPASRKTGRVVVVEGYMDVIALANAGIEDAVAPLGTALTERQIELLWRMVERPVLCFDGDAAGQKAAMRAATRALPLLRPGHSLGIVRMPQGLDPDDLVRTGGAPAFESVLKNATNLIDAIWNYEIESGPLDSPEQKAGFKNRLLEHVQTIADPDIRRLYKSEFLEKYFKRFFGRNAKDIELHTGEVAQLDAMKFWVSNPLLRGQYLQKRLGAAIAFGLMLWPNKLAMHMDDICTVDPEIVDRRISILVDFAGNPETFDRGAAFELIRETAAGIPRAKEWDELHFPFTFPEPKNLPAALISLEKAIWLYCNYSIVVSDIGSMTAKFSESPDWAFAEQQRLLKIKLIFQQELSDLLRKAYDQETVADDEIRMVHA